MSKFEKLSDFNFEGKDCFFIPGSSHNILLMYYTGHIAFDTISHISAKIQSAILNIEYHEYPTDNKKDDKALDKALKEFNKINDNFDNKEQEIIKFIYKGKEAFAIFGYSIELTPDYYNSNNPEFYQMLVHTGGVEEVSKDFTRKGLSEFVGCDENIFKTILDEVKNNLKK